MELAPASEQFLAVPGWSRYEASTLGRIRSCCNCGPGRNVQDGWRIISPVLNKRHGRLCVTLYRKGEVRKCHVSTLILEAFVGGRPEGQEARHLDGNAFNNRLDNLCWGTPLENSDDKRRHGTICAGSTHGMAKLTETQVVEIRRRRSTGESPGKIAKSFGVSQAAISMACLGDRWAHIPIDPSLPKPPRVKLNEDQAREIRRRVLAGEKQSRLAKEFNVGPSTVSSIKLGTTWPQIV